MSFKHFLLQTELHQGKFAVYSLHCIIF